MNATAPSQPETDTIIACTIRREPDGFELLIEDMESALGDQWGDLGFAEALRANGGVVVPGFFGPDRLADPTLEWTAEANPESFSPEVAAAWRAAGVTGWEGS